MQINVHRPTVVDMVTHDNFHTVKLTDIFGGYLTLFFSADWNQWDAIVAAVDEYREGPT